MRRVICMLFMAYVLWHGEVIHGTLTWTVIGKFPATELWHTLSEPALMPAMLCSFAGVGLRQSIEAEGRVKPFLECLKEGDFPTDYSGPQL